MAETATRNFVQRTSDYAAEKIEKSKARPEEATKIMEHSYTAAPKGAVDFNVKLIDLAQENVNDAFNFARELQRVQTPTAFFEVSAAHARKQWEKVICRASSLRAWRKRLCSMPLNRCSLRRRRSVRVPDSRS